MENIAVPNTTTRNPNENVHPLQPLSQDEQGTIRFKENKIVTYCLDHSDVDMNDIAMLDFSIEDRMQFAQLIGYSHSGYGELGYVSDDSYDTAHIMYDRDQTEEQAELDMLRTKLALVRGYIKEAAVRLFHIHRDDLT